MKKSLNVALGTWPKVFRKLSALCVSTSLLLICVLVFTMCDKETVVEDSVVISLDKEQITLEVGSTQRLTASFSPSFVENEGHVWRSADPKIATVDDTGMITAISEGTTTVTATALAVKSSASCKVTVVEKLIPVSSIVLSQKEEFIIIGSSKQITATVKPDNATDQHLTWSSSNSAIATVSQNGVVTGLAEGQTVITATSSNDITAQCTVTVGYPDITFSTPTAKALDDTSINVSCQLTPHEVEIEEVGICYSTDKTPYCTDNPHIVETKLLVNHTLTSLKANTKYYIRVYAKSGKSVFYSNTVECSTIQIPVTSVVLSSNEEFLLIGSSKQLTATVSPGNATDKTIAWSSSNSSIATVSQTGVVTALAEGQTVITAMSSNDKSAQCTVTVGYPDVIFSALSATAIDDTSIKVSCSLTPRAVEIEEVGICYSTDKTPDYTDNPLKVGTALTVNHTITGLKDNTEYLIRVYAKSGTSVFYSNIVTCSTKRTITTDFKLTDVYEDKLYFTTPETPSINICYGRSTHPVFTDYTVYATLSGDNYIVKLTNLLSGSKYYLRAYTLKNGVAKYYETEGSATTLNNSQASINRERFLKVITGSTTSYQIINYTLPDGNYEVRSRDNLIKVIPQSPSAGATTLYMKGGTGTLYQISQGYGTYVFYEVTFKNLETNVVYHLDQVTYN